MNALVEVAELEKKPDHEIEARAVLKRAIKKVKSKDLLTILNAKLVYTLFFTKLSNYLRIEEEAYPLPVLLGGVSRSKSTIKKQTKKFFPHKYGNRVFTLLFELDPIQMEGKRANFFLRTTDSKWRT